MSKTNTPTKTRTSLSRHRSVWEMRADGWISLVDDLSRSAILPPDDPERLRRLAHIHQIIESLAPIESYWAFPGGRVFGELCQWIEREELPRAHQAARRIHRVLAARTYRHAPRWKATTSCPRRSRPRANARPSCHAPTSRY